MVKKHKFDYFCIEHLALLLLDRDIKGKIGNINYFQIMYAVIL